MQSGYMQQFWWIKKESASNNYRKERHGRHVNSQAQHGQSNRHSPFSSRSAPAPAPLCRKAGCSRRGLRDALWVSDRGCPYPRNGGNPHSRMYVITPAAQMSTLRPYLKERTPALAKSSQHAREGTAHLVTLPFPTPKQSHRLRNPAADTALKPTCQSSRKEQG